MYKTRSCCILGPIWQAHIQRSVPHPTALLAVDVLSLAKAESQ